MHSHQALGFFSRVLMAKEARQAASGSPAHQSGANTATEGRGGTSDKKPGAGRVVGDSAEETGK